MVFILGVVVGLVFILVVKIIVCLEGTEWQPIQDRLTVAHAVFLRDENVTIPPILHKTGRKAFEDIDPAIKTLFKDIEQHNPAYTIRYYNDQACRAFIAQHYEAPVVQAFDTLRPGAYKSDLFRYCVLYKVGGVYGDLTQQYYRPLDDIIDRATDTLVLVQDKLQPRYKQGYLSPWIHGIQINFMAAIPGLAVYWEAIQEIVANVEKRYYGNTPLDVTGPLLFRAILNRTTTLYRIALRQDGSGVALLDHAPPYDTVIKTKLTTVHSKELEAPHYSQLWFLRQIYKT
jgi:mannosyltransferase OCH1-like enzyme